jgi:hypothetical protein
MFGGFFQNIKMSGLTPLGLYDVFVLDWMPGGFFMLLLFFLAKYSDFGDMSLRN